MVAQHYRWDFYGLSTQQKPTPEQSEKVVNGSTFYCADTSKLYVFCDGTWYEKTVSGGGGGTSDFEQLSNRPKYNGTTMTGSTDIPAVPSVVQTSGNSEANVMSQNAVTSMIFADPTTTENIKIGSGATNGGSRAVAIGQAAQVNNNVAYGIAVGRNSHIYASNGIAIGQGTTVQGSNSFGGIAVGHSATVGSSTSAAITDAIAFGRGAAATMSGEINVEDTIYGAAYNGTRYRLLRGLYDGQADHDAATYGQLNTRLGGFTLLQITQTAYDALVTKDPSTLYIIVGA